MAPEEHLDGEQVARQVRYWRDLAQYDLETAKIMLVNDRYLYVGFMCHQVIEKALKGLIVCATRSMPPYTHALVRLAKSGGSYDELPTEDQALLDVLEPLNIEARFPAQKDALLRSLSAERCRTLIENTERLLTWISDRCDAGSRSTPE
ncbi:HEPN domain-containing protein [bacterium]|nr:HEPN domain-containing protein [bacterium]